MKKLSPAARTVHVFEPLHKRNMYLLVGHTPEEVQTVINGTLGTNVDLSGSLWKRGKTLDVVGPKGSGVFIWLKYFERDVLVHEVVHGVAMMYVPLGYKFDEDQELYSYASQFYYAKLIDGYKKLKGRKSAYRS